jgi:sugar phosphate isomerase/epimerase
LDADDPTAIAAELQQTGLHPCALSLYTRDPQRLQMGVEFAAKLKAPMVVNGTVGRDWDELETFLRPALDAAAQTGVRLAIENHTDTLLDASDRMAEFCRRFPADLVGIAFAPPHAWVVGERPNELVHRFADRLLLVYLWDVAPQNRGLAWWRKHWHEFPEAQFPGKGSLDFVALADALQVTGCQAQRVICLHGTEPWGIEQLQAHLRETLTFLRDCGLA